MRAGRANLARTGNPHEGHAVRVEVRAPESVIIAPKFHAIETINLVCGEPEFNGSINSGAEISVIRKSIVPLYEPMGTNMKVTGAFGDEAVAELAYAPLRLLGKPQNIGRERKDLGILCAVTGKLANGADALITPKHHRKS